MNRRSLFGRIGQAAAAVVAVKVLPSPAAAAIPEFVPGDLAPHAWVDGVGMISRQTMLEQWGLPDIEQIGGGFGPDERFVRYKLTWPANAHFTDKSVLRITPPE